MRIFVDLDTQKLVQGLGVATDILALKFKRAPAAPIEVQFSRAGAVVELNDATVGVFGVKVTDKYDADYTTSANFWIKSGTGTETVYTFTLSLINAALDALFFVDGNADNDVAELIMMGELQWIDELGNVWKTPTVKIIVDNDVVREYDFDPPDFMLDDTDPDNPVIMLGDDNQPLLNG